MSLLSSLDAPDETPVDHWLARQADLTAVERFSRQHDGDGEHLRRCDLLPLAQGPGSSTASRSTSTPARVMTSSPVSQPERLDDGGRGAP
jgi:hypothetical protein